MSESYQVLARKYRPSNFDQLIGQEALVRTLNHEINNRKIAHSFILTGIRGVGKTTTARIIAKALNCLGQDGKSTEPQNPCGICSNCVSITNSRHQDVIEIDAASRTGVDDIRVIIDSINYAPALARYKVYIIDEVHMLSNNAFNALLKTLEEPPAHTKFVFATTEIRKVPITVLSRCQRFDLRRLSAEELSGHLKNVLQQEDFTAENEALSLIAEAADGSVRDALSITDRVLSYSNYQKILTLDTVNEILGLNDQNKILDLFTAILQGDIVLALRHFNQLYENSTDISQLLHDLQRITHATCLFKTINDYQTNSFLGLQTRIKELSTQTTLTDLAKIWQMLLKGGIEIDNFTNQKIIMEMLLIRICHLASLPNLEQIINHTPQNPQVTVNNSKTNNDMVGEIMRNFPQAKIVS